jgi:hypothetical protein
MTIKDVRKWINSATKDEIDAILLDGLDELWAREERSKKREGWVNEMYRSFLGHPNATDRREGNMTIMALYERNSGVKIGIAKCLPTDTFDERVGLAVAYAKAIGVHVPDYI